MVTKAKQAEEILSRFNQWVEGRQSELRACPPQSAGHAGSLLARIQLLQSAKYNLRRIVREVENGLH